MSHYSVVAALPHDIDLHNLESELSVRLARYNEGTAVEPYRDYEDGAPGDHWFVASVRRGAARLRMGEVPEVKEWRAAAGETVDTLLAGWAKDAEAAGRLGDDPGWADVVREYNAYFHPETEVATVGDDRPTGKLGYDEETGRAYQMSTYNPDSKWDYWRIGGRWAGYFLAKSDGPGLVSARRDWDAPTTSHPDYVQGDRWVDGGPKRLLDLDGMRERAAVRAGRRYDDWLRATDGTEPGRLWRDFVALAEAKEMTLDEAREQYHAQPRYLAAREAGLVAKWGECPFEEFLPDRDEYVANARAAAVPGYALVTAEGEWMAPGRMGWFGMGSDEAGTRAAYHVEANRYIDSLPDSSFLVALDLHI